MTVKSMARPGGYEGRKDKTMNRERMKELLDAFKKIADVKEILEEVKDEERDAYDNLPENFQYGERGDEMQGYIEMLDEAYGYLDDAASVIEQI